MLSQNRGKRNGAELAQLLAMRSLLHTAKPAALPKLKRIWMALLPQFQKAEVFRSGFAMTPKLTRVKAETAEGQPQRGISARLERDRLPTAPDRYRYCSLGLLTVLNSSMHSAAKYSKRTAKMITDARSERQKLHHSSAY